MDRLTKEEEEREEEEERKGLEREGMMFWGECEGCGRNYIYGCNKHTYEYIRDVYDATVIFRII